jgi:hypothetical protein
MTRYNKARFPYEYLRPPGAAPVPSITACSAVTLMRETRASRRGSGDPLEARPTVRGWMRGHVREVAEAHTVCCGVASGSVVLHVSGAMRVVTTVAPCVTRCRMDHLAEMRGISLAIAGRIACKAVSLFEVFSCPWLPPTLFSILLAIARSQCTPLLPCPTIGIPEKLRLMTALFGSVGYCSGPSGHRASSVGGHG